MWLKATFDGIRCWCRIDPRGWEGAGRVLAAAGWILLTLFFAATMYPIFSPGRLLGVATLVLIGLGAALVLLLVARVVQGRSLRFWWGLLLTVAGLLLLQGAGGVDPAGQAAVTVAAVFGLGLAGGCFSLLKARGFSWLCGLGLAGGSVLAGGLALASIVPGWDLEPAARPEPVAPRLALPDPGAPGGHAVTAFTYGPGTDRYRAEFGSGVALRSRTVDGSPFLEGWAPDGWAGAAGWARTHRWGFDATALPLNGRVWLPAGEGPFPVVLIVHGNHDMEDYSDTGYAWLGEHVASHGMLAVSVDQNFLNSGYSDLLAGLDGGLGEENDARGWLLLEHLRQLRDWHRAAGNALTGKLDLERVVLVGHSRGGEAITEAALFNRLPVYPDDARQAFDFGFGIQGLIAIAPIDDQYDPRGRSTVLEDVNYLVVHGSLDGDVQSFAGASMFARLRFAQCSRCFRSSVYIPGANHGQFNTAWGRSDLGFPGRLFLNLEPIMQPQVQRDVARVLFGAFLQATLLGREDYREVFAMSPRAMPWGDQSVELISDFRSGDELAVADFEEDADLTSGTLAAARISAAGLSRWNETEVALKWGVLDSAAVRLGWDRTTDSATPFWRIDFDSPPPAFAALSWSMAMLEESPLGEASAPGAPWGVPASIDCSIVVSDRNGQRVTLTLADLGLLSPPVHGRTRKHPWLDRAGSTEPVFQRFVLNAARLAGLDPAELASLEFRFDRTVAGLLLLDDITLTPAPAVEEPFETEAGG